MNPDGTTTTNYIDLYKARHFVNETKQGSSVDASPDELALRRCQLPPNLLVLETSASRS